jgi:hypothetical protein
MKGKHKTYSIIQEKLGKGSHAVSMTVYVKKRKSQRILKTSPSTNK